MNLLKTTSLLFFSLSILFNSCSVEKRLYRPGYNLEWKSSRISASTIKHEDASTDLTVSESRANKSSLQEKENEKIIPIPSKQVTMEKEVICDEGEVLAVNNHIQSHQINTKEVKSPLLTDKMNGIKNLKTIAIKKISKMDSQSEDGNGALKGIGWFFIILGIIVLIFVSILIGILLMLLGLLFFVVGKSN
jgi:hypothetical protein